MPDRRVAVALILTAVAAVLLQQYGQVPMILRLLPMAWRDAQIQLHVRILWVTLHGVFYIAAPLLAARACGLHASDLGLRFRVTRKELWIVAGVVCGAFPLILLCSRSAVFQSAYPLYRPTRLQAANTALWFAVFAVYLFSIELYFRGFLFGMLTPALGRHALYVSLVPYVATHGFLPEALGAIPVGLLLGALRMRTDSLWLGYLAHFLVAAQIELIALFRHGLLT
jgi:membrane protease YdiL (CAAX protease family)